MYKNKYNYYNKFIQSSKQYKLNPNTTNKGNMLEYYIAYKYNLIKWEDIDKDYKLKNCMSINDKGIDLVDFKNKYFVQCKFYELSNLRYSNICTFEYYSNYLNSLPYFKNKYRKILIISSKNKIDDLITNYSDISVNFIDLDDINKNPKKLKLNKRKVSKCKLCSILIFIFIFILIFVFLYITK